jgi:hypothetical protein
MGVFVRIRRRAVVGTTALVILASVLTVTASTATAAAVPTAPHTALTVRFEAWGVIEGNFSYEPSRNSLQVFQQTPNGYAIFLQGGGAVHSHSVNVTPPIGSQFAAGTTYPTIISFSPSPTQTVINISGDGQLCEFGNGTLEVLEANYDGAGLLTAFAARFATPCSGNRSARGEIRFQSSLDYRATDSSSPDSLDNRVRYGQEPVGMNGETRNVNVEVNGTLPTTFGTATLSGTNPSAFTIASDSCSGNTLNYGQTCAVQVTATATALGEQTALLTLTDDSFTGRITRLLTLEGFDPRDATVSPTCLCFGDVPAFDTSAPQTVTVTGATNVPITFGPATITGENAPMFTKTADTCSGVTLGLGQTCTMTVTVRPTVEDFFINALLSLPDDSVAGATHVSLSVNGFTSDRGTYFPHGPFRIMDTRSGLGGHRGKIGAGAVAPLRVAGVGGIPSSNLAAVALNVTVTGPTRGSHLTVYPTGVERPTTSSLNFPAGFIGANQVTVAVGDGGRINIYNHAGATDVIVDILGYYSSGAPNNFGDIGGQYHPVRPIRLADTREWGIGRIPAGFYITVPAGFGAINPHVRAFAVNITAVSPVGGGYLTAWHGGDPSSLPNASTLNFEANKVVPNFAIVRTTPCEHCGSATDWPSIGVFTSRATHILVDIVGFYDDATVPDGLRFTPNVPTRIADTRSGLGWPSKLGQGTTATMEVPGSLAGPDTWAVAMNVTAVQPSATTYLTVWPTGIARPTVSNLNPAAGAIVPNAVQTLISPQNQFNVYNYAGTVHVLADVVGTFYLYPGTATSLATAQAYTSEMQQRDGLQSPSGSSLVKQTR